MSGKTVYLLLFRGVGGKTQLPTAPLRQVLTAAGFENVATYINSGNAVLRSTRSRDDVRKSVAAIVKKEFGFDKAIHVPTLAEWSKLIADNPFPEGAAVPKFLHAAVLESDPDARNIESVKALAGEGEGFAVVGRVAYLHTPNGFGTSRLAEKFDRAIGVENTARNWNTVLKLAELAEKAK